MKKLFTSLSVVFTFFAIGQTTQSFNQLPIQNDAPLQRSCGTGILPQQFEDWVQSITPSNNKGGQNNTTQSILNIPVIVHIVHNAEALNSIAATTGGNLNAAQVIDQINILNKDFNGTNVDTNLIPAVFKPLLGKFQINFCLAVVNPTGGILAEPGIDRINRVSKGWTAPPYSTAYCDATMKPNSIWDVNRYFNIWVMSLGSSLLGYATFPNPGTTGLLGLSAPFGGPTTDGVVILNTAFGSIGTAASFVPYNKGRTTTHEVGHWIGLRHIWGDASCGNDYCNDTPTQQALNFNCPAFPKISCSNGPNGEMHMNYMDYTNDACMYMFSKDQKYRAQLIMTGSTIRAALLTSTVCNLPAVGHDIGITYVASPTYSQIINCSNKITPVVNLRNWGTTTLTTSVIYFNRDGVNTQTVNWAGSLAPSAAVNYTLPQIINIPNGAHAFNATVTLPNSGTDNNTSNNINNQSFSIANSFTMTANSPSICTSQNATLTASGGASSYTWNPGNIVASSAVVSPASTTIYTLSGSSGTCINTYTTSVTVSSSLNITTNNGTICAGGSTVITATGATNYTWSTGPFTSTISVTPPIGTTVYTVTGTNGSCSGVKTTTVIVNPNPTVTVNSATICSGNNATLSAIGAATYSWNTSATTSSITVSPVGTTVYTVNGYNGNCVNTKTAQVTVNITPTVTVNSPSICTGNSTTLTASGATTFSWSSGPTTASISVSPPVGTTVYTVTGTSTGCTNVKTATVTVNPNPTVTVNSATICSGNFATLTAIGATTYSWSSGPTTSSISVSPTAAIVYTVTGTSLGCTNTKTAGVNVNPNPTVTVNSATICSGNSATLTAIGATTYSWSSGPTTASISVNPISTTVYTVTGTSLGCTNTKTANVTVNTTPTVNVNSYTICPSGSATLTATGAVSYSWSNGPVTTTNVVSPASTTVYTVTGTSNGCTNSKTATVTIGTGISVLVSPSSQTICSGSSATISASGATSYTWSNSSNSSSIIVTPTTTTTYSILGVSGVCSGTNSASVNITVPATISMNISNVPCNSMSTGAATTNPSGGAAPYTYSYSIGPITQTLGGLSAGNYSVMVTTAFGCVSTQTFAITQPSPINASASSTNATCIGCTDGIANVMVIGGTGPYTYTWMPAGGNASVVTNFSAGCYTVNITDANNCASSQTVCVGEDSNGGVGLTSNTIYSETLVYPNPTSGSVTLAHSSVELRSIKLYDLLGKLIMQTQSELMTTEMNLSGFANGVYYLRVSGSKSTNVIRLVKQ